MPRLFGRKYTRRQLQERIGDMSQLMHVRRAEMTEGTEQGSGLIDIFNASGLNFSILPGRCLDIASAQYKGMSLCFRSNTGDVGPAFYEPQGFGWLRGFFGGLITSCGMTFTGHPEIDPEEENEELGLHGRLSYIPARQVAASTAWEGDDFVARVTGKMREAVVFGTNLELSRSISAVLGEKRIRIHDCIENLNVNRSPLMFVYHCNLGFPLLDVGARVVLHSARSTEWLEDREVGPDEYTVATPPRAKMHDDLYVHWPLADSSGQIHVALVNDKLELGLYFKFNRSELPVVTHWQHFHKGTYVSGIEVGNASMLGRSWNRQHGTLQHIEPGEIREFNLEIGVLDGVDEINNFERDVARNLVRPAKPRRK